MAYKRIGVFGGTFDPPHLGHLLLAEEIREDFELDEVYFMPCNQPPHKDRPDLSEAKHRFAMVVAATLQNPAFVASPIEVNRPGKSYSIDTLHILLDDLGSDTEIVFIAGLDSFLEIETWKDWEELLDLCHFIIVGRPGHSFDEIGERLPDHVAARLVDLRGGVDPREFLGRRRAQGRLTPPAAGEAETDAADEGDDGGSEGVASGSGAGATASGQSGGSGDGNGGDGGGEAGEDGEPSVPWRIFFSDAVHVDISSTEIRERVRDGRSARYRVSSEVERYIEANGLYRHLAPAKEAAS